MVSLIVVLFVIIIGMALIFIVLPMKKKPSLPTVVSPMVQTVSQSYENIKKEISDAKKEHDTTPKPDDAGTAFDRLNGG
jgi:hypothetical protein